MKFEWDEENNLLNQKNMAFPLKEKRLLTNDGRINGKRKPNRALIKGETLWKKN